jgi:hypothetical protein
MFVGVGEITRKREFRIIIQVTPNIIACGHWQGFVFCEPICEMVTNDKELTGYVTPFVSALPEPRTAIDCGQIVVDAN